MQGYEKSYEVLAEKLDCEKSGIEGMLDTLEREGISQIVSAEKVEDDTSIRAVIVLEIENEEIHKYRLYINQYFHIFAILDVETEDYVYFATK